MDEQIGEQVAEEGQRQSLKKKIKSTQPSLLVLFILGAAREEETDGQTEEAETDRRRICQEQSLRTVYDQMNTLCPLSLSLFPSTFFISLYFPLLFPFAPSLLARVSIGLRRCKHKAADVTHYFRQKTCCVAKRSETPGSLVHHLFSQAVISNHERADGDAEHLWLQRAQAPPPFSGQPDNVFSCHSFHSSAFCKKPKHDSGALQAYYWLNWCLILRQTVHFEKRILRFILDLGNCR